MCSARLFFLVIMALASMYRSNLCSDFSHVFRDSNLEIRGDVAEVGDLPVDVGRQLIAHCDRKSMYALRGVNKKWYSSFINVIPYPAFILVDLTTKKKGETETPAFENNNVHALMHLLHDGNTQFKHGIDFQVTKNNNKEGWKFFANVLKNQHHVRVITDQARPGQFDYLLSTLAKNTIMHALYLDHNNIPACDMKRMKDLVEKSKSLKLLYLRDSDVGDFGAKAIASGLQHNTTLQYIDLVGAGVKSEGAKSLAKSLMKNTTLAFLDLHNNRIGDEGAMAFNNALVSNTGLQRLYISSGMSPHVKSIIGKNPRITVQ